MFRNYLEIFIIGCLLGAGLCYWLAPPKTITQTVEKPVIQEKVVTQTHTEVQYIPKEVDPKTGQLEKTDVQLNATQPTVNVKVNGKEYQFDKLQTENQKFDKGKVLLDQSSTISFEVKIPEPPKHDIGLGYGTHGIAAMYGQRIVGNVGGWIYGDKDTVAGGIKISW